MKQRGFSIIEIAVTLVVLGILMTSAIPNITSWLRNTKLRNQAETTLSGLQQARNEAVRRNRPVSFWLVSLQTATQMDDHCTVSATGTSWVVSGASPDSKCATTPDGVTAPQIIATRVGADGSNGVSVSGLQADGSTAASSVTFDGFGRATGDLRRVNVSFASEATDDRPLRIEISPSGLTRMCDTKVGTTGDPRKCSSSNFQ
jgi:type IV fimbrial biogenesis protein FimT